MRIDLTGAYGLPSAVLHEGIVVLHHVVPGQVPAAHGPEAVLELHHQALDHVAGGALGVSVVGEAGFGEPSDGECGTGHRSTRTP